MTPIGLRPLVDTSAPRIVRRRLEGWERRWRAEEAHEYYLASLAKRAEYGLTDRDLRDLTRWIDRIHAQPVGGVNSAGATRGRLLTPPMIFSNDTSKLLKSWHRADLGVTTGSGGGVASAADQCGNGHLFSQATVTNQPAINLTGLNGRVTWVFDASGDHLINTGTLAAVAAGNDRPFASWSICRFSTDVLTTTKYSYLWGFGYSGGTSAYVEFYGGYTATAWVCAKASNTNVVVTSTGSAPGVAANTNYLVEYYNTGTSVEVVVNGVSCTMTNGGALDTAQADPNQVALHALPRSAVVSSNAALSLSENLFANGKPNNNARGLLRTYFTRTWGF